MRTVLKTASLLLFLAGMELIGACIECGGGLPAFVGGCAALVVGGLMAGRAAT